MRARSRSSTRAFCHADGDDAALYFVTDIRATGITDGAGDRDGSNGNPPTCTVL